MFPYIIAFSLSIMLFFIGERCQGKERYLFYALAILPPSTLAGCRDLVVGTDTDLYPYPTFVTCLHSHSLGRAFNYVIQGLEELYVTLAYLVSRVSSSHHVFLFVCHIVILGTLILAFLRAKVSMTIAFSLFYPMFFAETLNVARQCLAMPFCILSFAELKRKNYVGCILSLLIAFGFHHSSLFFVTVLLLYRLCIKHYDRMKRKSTVLGLIAIIVAGVLLFNAILTSIVGIGIADVKYLERYGSGDMYGSGAPISLFAINTFNFIMFILFSNGLKKTPFVVFLFYVMLISLLLCFTGFISTFAIRLNFYFMVIAIISMSYLMLRSNYLFPILTYSFYSFYWFMVVVVANLGETYPYQSKVLSSIF